MRVQSLHDDGSAKKSEDGLIISPPYYGVTDGVSGVYLPEEGPKLFDGKTGGQLASDMIVKEFSFAGPYCFRSTLQGANWKLGEIAKKNNLFLNDPAFLPSACFSICELTDEKVYIKQGGDTLAVWQLKDGSLGGTPNKNFQYEKFLTDTIAELMAKNNGDRQKMWQDFRPILIDERRKYSKEYGLCLLNGQTNFYDNCNSFSIELSKLHFLILFTDGFIPFETTNNVRDMANYVISQYNYGGVDWLLNKTREANEKEKLSTHEDFPEATAVALEF